MHVLLIITFMVIIGALIGGITNVIAIRMLFHPFKPYYIFKFRIPFTPGLIPKRRDEIAQKIGQVIEDHLITEDMIRYKLNQSQSKETILDKFYLSYKRKPVTHVLPQQLIQIADNNIDKVTEFLCERARIYLNSAKGTHDIYEMLDTFFQEKGKIIGLLQMFMTKESIAERIQYELIRLTEHPKARSIINKVIHNEYETLKYKQLGELIGDD
ncbi:membrane protein [Staphylococcus saccharolyticus]|uniref:Membrane protein n=1 Tax=Staphylococcus saccharolyticus TaxID=33028 RepID=A0A380H2M1_9STAP|nr:membrane protein [Staphylococcus saccharolyticus]